MNGSVKKSKPKVWVTIKDKNGWELKQEALLDTGFTGTVSVPAYLIGGSMLSLDKAIVERDDEYFLGNGTPAKNTTYNGEMLYPDGTWKPCLVESMSSQVVVGMEYLKGFLLVMECSDGKAFWVGKNSFLPALLLKYLPRGV